MTRQPALALGLEPEPQFSNFIATGNEETLNALQIAVSNRDGAFLSLWGAAGTGKSHLLQACCRQAAEQGRRSAYLALPLLLEHEPDCLAGFEAVDLIGLDDLDALAGQPQWQEAVHHLYNALRQSSGVLISASRNPPRELPLSLGDLKSRLGWGPSYHLRPLDDDGKCQALRQLAQERGLELSAEAASYLIKRSNRDMHQLVALLEHMDRESLAEQRRLSIPFIREHIEPPKSQS